MDQSQIVCLAVCLAVLAMTGLYLYPGRGDLSQVRALDRPASRSVVPPTPGDGPAQSLPRHAGDPDGPLKADQDQPYQLLVKFRGGLHETSAQRFLAQRNLRAIKHLPRVDIWLVASGETPTTGLLHDLERSSDVLWAEKNGRVRASGIPPDDNYYAAQQWNLQLIGLPEAWAFTTGDARPIAVIDTGIDLDHLDLAAKIWTNSGELPANGLDDDDNGYIDDVHGWNFISGSTLLIEAPHGTHVAGIAAAHTDNEIGIAGVSWQSPIMPLQALRQDGEGTVADVAEAIIYAADNGARVLNLSLGGEESSETMELAVAYARERGCLLVAAVGNDEPQPKPVEYPAALPGVLAVAATTAGDSPASFSNRGPEVDVAAPGVDIFSTSSFNSYAIVHGTSMATPHVSGLVALVWALRPTLTADQVAHVITTTAHDVSTPGWDELTGWGRVDAHAAILETKPYRSYLPVIELQFSCTPAAFCYDTAHTRTEVSQTR